ncbi:MAG: (d)CMP kinase [Lachnospiraceae bacterium]|nr:(d)CMP kinase [Lachnospiraceae bacterium]
MNIAIDGPAGAGKSTIAKLVSAKLGYIYVDTGAMFRAVAYNCTKNGIDKDDTAAISESLSKADISIKYVGNVQRVFLNDEDVTDHLRDESVGNMASVVARIPAVRSKLLELQRKLARENDVVMDGRDIGTCVLPDAELKVYLTASSAVRAKRRYDELVAKGETPDIDVIEKDIIERDERDMNREIAPLKQADDAVLVDSSYMTIDEVAAKIISLAEEAGAGV